MSQSHEALWAPLCTKRGPWHTTGDLQMPEEPNRKYPLRLVTVVPRKPYEENCEGKRPMEGPRDNKRRRTPRHTCLPMAAWLSRWTGRWTNSIRLKGGFIFGRSSNHGSPSSLPPPLLPPTPQLYQAWLAKSGALCRHQGSGVSPDVSEETEPVLQVQRTSTGSFRTCQVPTGGVQVPGIPF